MADKVCHHKMAFEESDHPHLEPACVLVYMYMDDAEIEEDELRRKSHIKKHMDNALNTM